MPGGGTRRSPFCVSSAGDRCRLAQSRIGRQSGQHISLMQGPAHEWKTRRPRHRSNDLPSARAWQQPHRPGLPTSFSTDSPAARQGDASACGSPMISAVSSTVLIKRPAVTLGSIGAHGNVVIGGSGTVLIGDVFTPAPRAPALPLTATACPVPGASSSSTTNGQARRRTPGQGLVEWRLECVRHHGCRRHDLLDRAPHRGDPLHRPGAEGDA